MYKVELRPRYNTAMQPNDFLRRLPDAARSHLPSALRGFQVRHRGRLLQLWYGDDARIHYEVWIHDKTVQIELGLHFEATPARNEWFRRQFASCLIELKAALGNGVEVELWDK